VVTLSTGLQVHPDPAFRRKYREGLGIPHLFYADERIRALGEREGFPVVNLAPAMQVRATWERLWLHGFPNTAPGVGHWNRDGHAIAAEIVADALCRGR
jgi:hypothetical protein